MASGNDAQVVKFGKFDIHRSEIFTESSLSFAFVNLKPVVPGHLLVSPKRVVPRFCDLLHEEVADLWILAQRVGRAAEGHFKADSLTLAIQDGPHAGQTVPHVHIHVLPRRPGDFENNDEVYDAIDEGSKHMAGEKLDLDKDRRVRTHEEMAAEASDLPLQTKLGKLAVSRQYLIAAQLRFRHTFDRPILAGLLSVSHSKHVSASSSTAAWAKNGNCCGIPSFAGPASMQHRTHGGHTCHGFVGESTAPAGAYYANDFSWEELRDDPETVAALARQAESFARQQPSTQNASGSNDTAHDPQELDQSAGAWEAFHAKDNATARFYKERRYLLLEFPQLAEQRPSLHVLEIGCGCGSALLPVLKGNPCSRATGTDISPTAVTLFLGAAQQAGIASERVAAFACDAAQPGASPLAGIGADVCLMVFTLGAVNPCKMHIMLITAWQALQPGGLLLFRDHGLLDITHLRLKGEQQLEPSYFSRADGTTCYFFSVEDLAARAAMAGFSVLECSYACTRLSNRRRQLDMRRVFVHGVFKKPAAP